MITPNIQLYLFLHHFSAQSDLVFHIATFMAVTLPYIVVIATLLFLLFHKKNTEHPLGSLAVRIKEIAVFASCSLASWVIVAMVKHVFGAARPYIRFPNSLPIFYHGAYDSFPSGHAAFFFALATSIYFYHRPAGIMLFICAALIGLARIVAGIHFPIDILGGAVLGVLVALITRSLGRRIIHWER